MMKLWIVLEGQTKTGLILSFKYFWCIPDIPDIFSVNITPTPPPPSLPPLGGPHLMYVCCAPVPDTTLTPKKYPNLETITGDVLEKKLLL